MNALPIDSSMPLVSTRSGTARIHLIGWRWFHFKERPISLKEELESTKRLELWIPNKIKSLEWMLIFEKNELLYKLRSYLILFYYHFTKSFSDGWTLWYSFDKKTKVYFSKLSLILPKTIRITLTSTVTTF